MTREEMHALLLAAPPTVELRFRNTDDENFVAMKAGPCPLFMGNTCTVYESRPYNCRRFGCMRPDPTTEPFLLSGNNMMLRVRQDKDAAKLARWMQRKAQPWAESHGWKVGEKV